MSRLGRRLAMLLHWRRWRRELAEEMAVHRQYRAGRMGNELRLLEQSQQVWLARWAEELAGDLRHGLRLLARTPLVRTLALVTLALGIGANTALFSLTDAILMRPLPVRQPAQLEHLIKQFPQSPRASASFTNPMWEQVRDHQDAFSSAFAWSLERFNLGAAGEQHLVWGAYASGGYFPTLGISAERGRLFGPGDDHPGCPAVADISDAYWHSRFGAAEAAIGSTLSADGQPYTILGVMPASFFGTDPGIQMDMVAPLCTEALRGKQSMLNIRDAWWLQIMGRRRPGVSEVEAAARLEAQAPAWWRATVPGDWTASQQKNYLGARVTLKPGGRGVSFLEGRYGTPLEVLLAIAGLVLLLACANLAGLMLARAAARRPEMAVRAALGASRARLVRQLLTEAVLLAVGGAAAGIAIAYALCGAAEGFFSNGFTVSLALSPDARVLAFTLGLTFATALLVGVGPALRATRPAAAARPGRSGRTVAAVQLALALVLLAAAGLFLRSFEQLTHTNPGFDPAGLVTVAMGAPAQPPPDAKLLAQRQAMLRALADVPGVTTASESLMIPGTGLEWDNTLTGSQGTIPDALFNAISPGYFRTLGSPLAAGRDFNDRDTAQSPPVIILNQAAARQLFPHGGALGSTVGQPAEPHAMTRPAQVVGIVGDAVYLALGDALPAAYYPLAQLAHPFPTTSFELRSSLPLTVLTPAVRKSMARVAPGADFSLGRMDTLLASTIKPQRMLAALAGLFGGLALLLSAIGLYAVATFNATRRRREFGVRVALGARPEAITRLMLADAARTLLWGGVPGIVVAYIAARLATATLAPLLFHLDPADVATLAAAAAVLAAATLLAAYIPARRAARADPLPALRQD